MKIESVRIENFRSFRDETIQLREYACLIGPNGAGKSTVLAALNVFFRQHKDAATDLSRLSADDFHHKNVDEPIRITVTFSDLSEQAKKDLADYVRQDKLVVSAVARYDPVRARAEVLQFGNRLGMNEFRPYFERNKAGDGAAALKELFQALRGRYPDLPDVKTKNDMEAALHEYEQKHPDACSLIPSEDQFYGATKGANQLAPHVQWVFVPAVKHMSEESLESKTSGLGQLLARTVRSKVNFSDKVGDLQKRTRDDYQKMLDHEQAVLDELSRSLQTKLQDWAHPQATARILWTQDSEKSVKVEEPLAYVRIGERGFEGELARFGDGMQRSFMLTLLQELATTGEEAGPSLVLAIEEPELYQHPPQARHLAEVLRELADNGSQILLCSHSPLFVPGDDFESVRIVKEQGHPSASRVSQLSYTSLAADLNAAGQKLLKEKGMLAKLYPTLDPTLSEMFFCKVLVLVEGVEDVAYLSSYLALLGRMPDFRRYGCHIVAVGGKSNLVKPIAMANHLKIPALVVFDADTDATKTEEIAKHKKDNKSILSLAGHSAEAEWPAASIWHENLTAWHSNVGDVVRSELGPGWDKHRDAAALNYGQPGGLEKNSLAIAWALRSAWDDGLKAVSLVRAAEGILEFAKKAGES